MFFYVYGLASKQFSRIIQDKGLNKIALFIIGREGIFLFYWFGIQTIFGGYAGQAIRLAEIYH